jgi:hypothetical protein
MDFKYYELKRLLNTLENILNEINLTHRKTALILMRHKKIIKNTFITDIGYRQGYASYDTYDMNDKILGYISDIKDLIDYIYGRVITVNPRRLICYIHYNKKTKMLSFPYSLSSLYKDKYVYLCIDDVTKYIPKSLIFWILSRFVCIDISRFTLEFIPYKKINLI